MKMSWSTLISLMWKSDGFTMKISLTVFLHEPHTLTQKLSEVAQLGNRKLLVNCNSMTVVETLSETVSCVQSAMKRKSECQLVFGSSKVVKKSI